MQRPNDDIERQLIEAGTPEPPTDLRARVLAAATPLVRANDSLIDRAWFAFRWRTAAALLFLIVAAQALAPQSAGPANVAENRRIPDVVKTVEVAALEAGLTPAQAVELGTQALAASRRAAAVPLNGFTF